MDIEASITRWIGELKVGGEDAAAELWESYFQKMIQVAKRRLGSSNRGASDEEDVAISAFHSFCRGAQAGRFTQLTDRHNLWPLLIAITANKSKKQLERANRLKRGGSGSPGPESGQRFQNAGIDIAELVSSAPTPEFVAQVSEEFDCLMQLLDQTGDASLKQIATWRMDGESTTQIAQRLGCVRRTIERKLKLISLLWNNDVVLTN